MHSLAWITSCRHSGNNSVQYLVMGYLVDAPPSEVSIERSLAVAPDLFRLFNWGRTVPLGADRPYVVKTSFLPGDGVLAPYRDVTGKIVYVVRDPRTLIASLVRNGRMTPEERAERAAALVARLGAMDGPGESRATWEQHVREWTSPELARAHFPALEDVCVLRFEDLHADPAAALRRVIGFLGVLGPVDEARVERTVATWTPETLREAPMMMPLPGLDAFQEPPPRPTGPGPGGPKPSGPRPGGPRPGGLPTLAQLGVEDAYRRRLQEDAAFAELVRRFGYES